MIKNLDIYSHARFPNHPYFSGRARGLANPLVERGNCVEKWYTEQTLDHFGFGTPPLNITTFNQRYFICDGYWNGTQNATILFYSGNESDIELYVNNTGLMYEMAPYFGALLVFVEHRYFGQTQPFGEETSKYMNYLSMEQAMADYAQFLEWFKMSMDLDNPAIISFGGSYGGMISAYFRMKYPGSIDGAIAASAPIMTFEGVNPPYDPNGFADGETADASPSQGSDEMCAPNIRSVFKNLLYLGGTVPGRKLISSAFSLCAPVQTNSDIAVLIGWLKSAFDFMSMGNYPYPSSYMTSGQGDLPSFPVRVACEFMNINSTDPATLFLAFKNAVGVFYNVTNDVGCYDIHGSVNNATAREILYWSYIYCTEIMVPIGQNGITDMFWSAPWNVTAKMEFCKQLWGVETRIDWMYQTYGGYEGLNASSNIFFSNGEMDPWHSGGVLVNISDTLLASLMPEAAHHLDLMFSNPFDPPSVTTTRQMQRDAIQGWINAKQSTN